jgi:hypothetical protein
MGCNLVLGLGQYKDGDSGAGGSGGAMPLTCNNGKRDGNETDLDCGGSCTPCSPGLGCGTAADCNSKVCTQGSCAQPTCTDAVKNGAELAVDCGGGTCPGCDEGSPCQVPTDCKSGQCDANVCGTSCSDGAKNGDETGTDCGGTKCGACPNGQTCLTGSDCTSLICTMGTCGDGYEWSKAFGGTDPTFPVTGKVAVGAAGNFNLGGTIAGSVDFGGGALNAVGSDLFLAKFSPTGSHIYSQNYGFTNNQFGLALAVDTNTTNPTYGDVSLGGWYQTSVTFGATVWSGIGGGLGDIQFAHFTPVGDPVWSKATGSNAATAIEAVHAVAIDPAGDTITTGSFDGPMMLDGASLNAQGNGDLFLFKHGAAGAKKFLLTYGDVAAQLGTGLGVDSIGNIYVTGDNSGTLNFGGAPLVSATGDEDVFLTKLDPNGTELWGFEYGDSSTQGAPDIAVLPNDQIALVGEFVGSITFGTTKLTAAGANPSNRDIFVVKLDGGGNVLWAKSFGDGSDQYNAHVALDANGNVLVICTGTGKMDFGGGPLVSAGGGVSGPDVFVAKLKGTDGSYVWATSFGDSHDQGALSIGSAGGDDVIFTASFDGTVTFGGGQSFTNVGAQDFALVRYQTPTVN